MVEMIIRNWRVVDGDPSGLLLWFDPSCETVRLYRTPPSMNSGEVAPGAAEVDEVGESGYLDKVVSVSASGPRTERCASDRFEQGELFREEDPLPF